MKALIFSDSHGDVATMRGVVEKERPDVILHLGDGFADAERIGEEYPDIEVIAVPGNVDSDREDEVWFRFVELRGRRFILTHGHTLIDEFADGRQTDANRIASRAAMLAMMKKHDADVFLHGHTHEPHISRVEAAPGKSRWIMNPGSIRRGGGVPPTYGVLLSDESGAFAWRVIEVDG